MDIKITEHLAKEKKEWKEIVPESYHQYPEVFEEIQFNKLPEHRVWDHKIDFVEGTDLSKLQCRVYPLTKEEDKEMNKFIDENLATGRIVRSESEIASPFFFVKKKTADLRPVQDYRKVNEATKKNRYPLPLINELLDKIKGAKWFTKMDVRKGYNNIRMRKGDEWKAAFKTSRGLFEPLVM
ncbi:MAG TPA: reverse transcriptase family protein, partial [Chlamydiales bacterium]|nr:reverse transcriptase family protein [Chlamydiales bacterium]